MERIFKEKKATQAAVFLLDKHGGAMSYMKLIKLLYLVDRKTLLKFGHSISNDIYFSLDHGPILSKILDIINEGSWNGVGDYWISYITKPIGYDVLLRDTKCSMDELSEAELEVLSEVFIEHGHKDKWELVDWMHTHIPEWQDPSGSRSPISYSDIFVAEERNPTEAVDIEKNLSHVAFLDRLIAL